MAQIKVSISSVLGGMAPTQFFGEFGTYNSAIGIDPDYPVGSDKKTSGMLTPTVYETFSGDEITGYPLWIITSPKDSNAYVYSSSGKITKYSSVLH